MLITGSSAEVFARRKTFQKVYYHASDCAPLFHVTQSWPLLTLRESLWLQRGGC